MRLAAKFVCCIGWFASQVSAHGGESLLLEVILKFNHLLRLIVVGLLLKYLSRALQREFAHTSIFIHLFDSIRHISKQWRRTV
jgi:hypothetical protein